MQVFHNAKTVKKEKKIALDGKFLWFFLGMLSASRLDNIKGRCMKMRMEK
jgi:hypothetical protein